ncbi:MAG TPA: BTAD domain-containing putative transcriptional regulator [Gemmatimonadaceae bacterium]|nr:BTAD domain-containing putative transcriptional regulator [Gemmatimonadaceae bacterium]
MLRINALGGIALLRDGTPVTGDAVQPRRLALLAALARAGSRGMTRERVLALFWPDTDEERARKILSQAIYSLRRGMGDEALIGSTELRLDPALVTSDVDEFAEAMRARDFERAVSLYAGPFLDGVRVSGAPDFDRWLDAERTALAHDYETALERLAKDAAAKTDWTRAAGWWRKRSALDPVDPQLALEVMRSLAAGGDKSGALQHARVFAALRAQDELPSDAKVEAFAQQLRDAPAEPVAPAALSPPPATAAVEANVATTPLPLDRDDRDSSPVPALRAGSARNDRWWLAAAAVAIVAIGALLTRQWVGSREANASTSPPTIMVGQISDYSSPSTADSTSLTRALGDMLATNLARAPGLRVVSSMRAHELLRGAGGGRDREELTAATFTAIAKQAGVRELVDGALYRLSESRFRLDLRRTDVSTGAVLAAHAVEGANVFALVDSGTRQLVAALGVAAPAGSVADVTTHSIAAYRLYVEGLRAYFRTSNNAVAHAMFEAALTEDSTFALAAFYSSITEPTAGRVLVTLPRAVRLAERASDRERLMIRAAWADIVSSPALGAIADTLRTRYPTEVLGTLYTGISLLRAGDFLAAVPFFERAISMDSVALGLRDGECGACSAVENLVLAYHLADSVEAAIRTGKRWTRLQPASPAPWMQLAGTLELLGRTEEGLAAYRKGIAFDPSLVLYPTHAATQYLAAYRLDDADRELRLLEAAPATRQPALWFRIVLLRQQGKMREALNTARAYRRLASEREPSTAPVVHSTAEAQVHLESGAFREAAALFDSIARADGSHLEPSQLARQRAWAFTHAANALAELGDTAALRTHADSVRLDGARSGLGRDGRLHYHIEGLRRRVAGDYAGAATSFRQAIYSPNLGYTRTNLELGRALVRTGRAPEAVATLQSALRGYSDGSNLYANRTELHEALADAWAAAGGADSARAHYRLVADAWANGDAPFKARAERAASLRFTR